jgi:hypothetical protein
MIATDGRGGVARVCLRYLDEAHASRVSPAGTLCATMNRLDATHCRRCEKALKPRPREADEQG